MKVFNKMMKWVTAALCGILLMSMAMSGSGLVREAKAVRIYSRWTTGSTSRYNTSSSWSTRSSSTGRNCFYCDSWRPGVCDTCEGDGHYEMLEGTIWGSRCKVCSGTGVCRGCEGDGILGN